jgi:hypothetical protein
MKTKIGINTVRSGRRGGSEDRYHPPVATVLFSGHMVDAPGRRPPRFPPERVPVARRAIAEAIWLIDDTDAEAISGLACGGDLLFAEEWLKTGRLLHAYLPREEADFLDESVRFAGEKWVDSFRDVTADPKLVLIGPDEEMLRLDDPHTANNLRMLDAASLRPGSLHGLFLWDGKGGDGPGGTEHLASAVVEEEGSVTVLRP